MTKRTTEEIETIEMQFVGGIGAGELAAIQAIVARTNDALLHQAEGHMNQLLEQAAQHSAHLQAIADQRLKQLGG